MRFNDKELRHYIKSVPAQIEGTLTFTDKKGNDVFHYEHLEFWSYTGQIVQHTLA